MVFLVCARIINRDKKVQGYLGKYYIKFFWHMAFNQDKTTFEK